MSLSDEIASKVKGKGGTELAPEDKTPEPEGMKAGDHGKRILAAISAKDPVAVENAIKDCAEDAGDYAE